MGVPFFFNRIQLLYVIEIFFWFIKCEKTLKTLVVYFIFVGLTHSLTWKNKQKNVNVMKDQRNK